MTISIGLPLLALEVDPSFSAAPTFTLAITAGAVPTAPDAETVWQVKSVGWNGSAWQTYAEYPNAVVQTVIFGISVYATGAFDIGMEEPDIAELPLANANTTPNREVQIYRNGQLLFFGPPITRRLNTKTRVWSYQCADPLWYLTKRYMGEATRHNWLTYDADVAHWTLFEEHVVTRSDDTVEKLLGATALKLNCSGPGENFVRRLVNITSGPVGLALFLRGWFWLDSITAPAFGERGALLQRVGADGPGSLASSTVNLDTNRRQWTPVDLVVNMPPNVTETIEVRLYAPHGIIHWDAVTLTVQESLSLTNETDPAHTGWEQELIACYALRYLSGRLAIGDPYTKSNLQIGDSIGEPSSGITKERTYQFFDHQVGFANSQGGGALDEWPRAADGFDIRCNVTPTTRVMKTYYPAVGVDRTAIPWTWKRSRDAAGVVSGENYAVVAVDYGETIEGSATDVTETGAWGSGSGKEEGGSSDAAAMGGLSLELVEAAPNLAPIDLLISIAEQRRIQLAKPLATPILTVAEPRDPITNEVTDILVGRVMPGDTIALLVDDFSLKINDGADVPRVCRITQVTINGPGVEGREDLLDISVAV